MQRQTEVIHKLARIFQVTVAVFLIAACSTSSTRAESEAKSAAPPAPPPAAALAAILTQIRTEAGNCTPVFWNSNCGGLGNPGDICVQAGSVSTPTKVMLNFVVAGPGANTAEIQKMNISLASNGSCPGDYQDDFPDFGNNGVACEYEPTMPGNAMIVKDDNEVTRKWNYTLTVQARAGCAPVTIHPIIENGGGNSSAGDG